MDNIVIAGQKVKLDKPVSDITKNLWLGLLVEFDLYQFAMNNRQLLLLVAKDSANYSPLQLSKIAQRIETTTQYTAVFYFGSMPTYERDRLVDKGVYFIVSDKFAFVPELLANRRLSKNEIPTQLLPSTQYLLLLHLQHRSLNGMTIKEIGEFSPYQYATLAKSAQQLAALGLAELSADSGRTKLLRFTIGKRELWGKALPHFINPIKRIGYSDEPLNAGLIGGIEALSHYSMLVGEDVPTRVFTIEESKELDFSMSRFEDVQRVEIWKYSPIVSEGYVDKLSLYISLRDDRDPRVEKELETMINEMLW